MACIIVIIIIKHPEYGSYRKQKKKADEGELCTNQLRRGRAERTESCETVAADCRERAKDSGWEASNTWQEKAVGSSTSMDPSDWLVTLAACAEEGAEQHG